MYFMGCEIDIEVSILFRPPKNFILKHFRKGSTLHIATFLLYVWTLLWKQEARFVENHRGKAGSLLAVTVAASAGLPVPVSAARLLHPVLCFPLLLEKILLAFSGAIIDMKLYVSLSYQHNDSIFVYIYKWSLGFPGGSATWSFKIYSLFPSMVK